MEASWPVICMHVSNWILRGHAFCTLCLTQGHYTHRLPVHTCSCRLALLLQLTLLWVIILVSIAMSFIVCSWLSPSDAGLGQVEMFVWVFLGFLAFFTLLFLLSFTNWAAVGGDAVLELHCSNPQWGAGWSTSSSLGVNCPCWALSAALELASSRSDGPEDCSSFCPVFHEDALCFLGLHRRDSFIFFLLQVFFSSCLEMFVSALKSSWTTVSPPGVLSTFFTLGDDDSWGCWNMCPLVSSSPEQFSNLSEPLLGGTISETAVSETCSCLFFFLLLLLGIPSHPPSRAFCKCVPFIFLPIFTAAVRLHSSSDDKSCDCFFFIQASSIWGAATVSERSNQKYKKVKWKKVG